jgi:cleavage and polyadenylation specificity factor subunit 3
MFLEAQFGADNIAPIAIPKVTNQQMTATESAKDESGADFEGSKEEDDEVAALQKQEIERLHKIGIPVPGVEIKVDKMVANVWLEDLEVECANRVFGDRVRAVVERAVEVTAPLWA